MKIDLIRYASYLFLLLIFLPSTPIVMAQGNKVDSLRQLIKLEKQDTNRALLLNKLAIAYGYVNTDSSLAVAHQLLKLSTRIGFTSGIVLGHTRLANVYVQKGDYSQSTRLALKALEQSEKLNMQANTITLLSILGFNYQNLEDMEKAKPVYLKALRLAQKIGDTGKEATMFNNLGSIFLDEKQYDSSLFYFQKALTAYQQTHYATGELTALGNIGYAQMEKKEYAHARLNFERALAISKEINDVEGIVYGYMNLADVCRVLTLPEKSLTYSLQALNAAKELNNSRLIQQCYQRLYKGYKMAHHFEKALIYRDMEIALRDSLYDLEKNKIVSDLQVKYEVEKKENEIVLLNNEKLIAQQARQNQNLLLGFISVVLLLVIALFVFQYRSTKAKKKLNEQLTLTNKEVTFQKQKLEELNALKSKLIALISHDLRSPLHSLHASLHLIQKGKLSDTQITATNQDIRDKLSKTVLMLNHLLEWAKDQLLGNVSNTENFNLSQLINNVLAVVAEDIQAKGLSVTKEINPSISVTADKAMIEIAFRNLITNAIKFSNRNGEIKISAKVKDQEVEIAVRDNGIGITEQIQDKISKGLFPETKTGTAGEAGTGLGLSLCREFIERNHGKFWFESKVGKGSTFNFTLPIQ